MAGVKKPLSGFQKRKIADEKEKEFESVINKFPKISDIYGNK